MTRPTSLDKRALRDELAAIVAADLATLERGHRAAIEGATHEEAKPENDKDTRALEQSYLARGQAQRIDELRAALAEVVATPVRDFAEGTPIGLGALVTAEEDGTTRVWFVAPHGGGARLAGGRVQVVTARSPLGRALVGKRAGEECAMELRGKAREVLILAVE